MNVAEYFEQAFPDHLGLHCDAGQRRALASMPLDSNCGDDCKTAVDRAKALDDLLRMGHGKWYPTHCVDETRAIANVAVELCCLYICG